MELTLSRILLVAALGALISLSSACPTPTGGNCEWERWDGMCELESVDDPTPPNSSGKVIVRARYRVTPAAASPPPPAEFVHAIFTTPEEAAGWRAHLEAHPSVVCGDARLTRGSCGPWHPTFELPAYSPSTAEE